MRSLAVYLARYASSDPNDGSIWKKGISAGESMEYISTLSAISTVLRSASGTSAKMAFISAVVLIHSCLEYRIRFGSLISLPVLRQISRSCASASSSFTKCASFVAISFTPCFRESSISTRFTSTCFGYVVMSASGACVSWRCSSR